MGESAICLSPTRLKPSRQVGSEARVRFRKGRCEAGQNKLQAVLLNPEICIVVEVASMKLEAKADVIEAVEGSIRAGFL